VPRHLSAGNYNQGPPTTDLCVPVVVGYSPIMARHRTLNRAQNHGLRFATNTSGLGARPLTRGLPLLRAVLVGAITFFAGGTVGCGGSSVPTHTSQSAPARNRVVEPLPSRPKPRTTIEASPEVPFPSDYPGHQVPSNALYSANGGDFVPIVPFGVGYEERAFHLIAYFDGHPTWEAVECMDDIGPGATGPSNAFAIITTHNNGQEYYVRSGAAQLQRWVNVPVHEADVQCSVTPDWKSGHIEFTLVSGERVSLRMTTPDAPEAAHDD
jgi:hypothetical protein